MVCAGHHVAILRKIDLFKINVQAAIQSVLEQESIDLVQYKAIVDEITTSNELAQRAAQALNQFSGSVARIQSYITDEQSTDSE